MNCMDPHCKGSRIPGIHDHHIIFKSHGGSDEDWNRIPLCAACHEYVHGRNNPKLNGERVTGRQYMIEILTYYKSAARWREVLQILVEKEAV